jgi:S-DNA-T family DNA segregation ATPase FtsK/SpoIIIE
MRAVLRVGTEEIDLDVQVAPGQAATVAALVGGLAPFGSVPDATPGAGLLVDSAWWSAATPLSEARLAYGSTLELSDGITDPPAAEVVLRARSGLDAGRTWPLRRGGHLAGRDPACQVRLEHHSVAPRHALILVSCTGAVSTCDLTSAHGGEARRVPAGRTVQIGQLELSVEPVAARRHPTPDYGPDGRAPLNRPPRPAPGPGPAPVTLPAPAGAASPAPPFSWASALVPLALGAVLAAIFGPLMAVFALLSPVVLVASWWEHRRRAAGQHARAEDEHRAAVERLRDELAAASAAEARRRAAAVPDLGDIVGRAETGSSRLWERRSAHPDVLVLRLGTGEVGWDPAVGTAAPPPDVQPLVDAARVLPGGPVSVDLAGRPVGIVGDHAVADAVARGLVLQAAVLHGPADLSLEIEAAGPAWDWVRWLPHHSADADDRVMSVIDRRGVSRPLAPLSGPRATALVLADRVDDLPSWCTTVIHCHGPAPRVRLADVAAGTTADVDADGVSAATALSAARRLARFRDPELRRRAALPAAVPLADVAPLDEAAVTQAWDRPGSVLPAVLGVSTAGPVAIDLTTDGPHTLLAGTTGSGKSELLRTLVASLAARSSPDDLAFVLIDFKGGSAFDRCAHLPHVTGVVTDLDPHLAARVLRSLEAELRHRERRLRLAGAEDLAQLRRAGPAAPPLPRLVVAVDELAVLGAEAPEFLPALVDVAQRGRSLGIHLVLATQRPTGAVSEQIRANTNLRIALRTIDASDSNDLIGVPVAAQIDRRTPGRGWLRSGGDPPRLFQAATGSGCSTVEPGPPVVVQPWPRPPAGGPAEGPDDLQRLITATRVAARAADIRPPRRPWLPPLPARATPSRLVSADRVVMALADDPDRQRRTTWCWNPAAGHLVVHGAPRSGVTTALRRAALGVHALGGETLVAAADRGAVRALVHRLHAEVETRRAQVAGRALLAVVVDRWPGLAGACTDLDGMRLLDDLVRLLAAGPSLGVVGLIGLDRAMGLPASLAPAATQRLVLRLADRDDALLAPLDLPAVSRRALLRFPPGRGFASPDSLEVQVALTPSGSRP